MKTAARVLAVAASVSVAFALAGCAGAESPDGPGSSGAAAGEAATADTLLGTWVVDETFDAPETPFLQFVDDGTWIGSDGCNRVQGDWTIGDKGAITVTSGPQTMIACDGAPLPMTLIDAATVSIVDDSLLLTAKEGANSAAETTLVKSDDVNVGVSAPLGKWSADDSKKAPFLELTDDGRYSGSDGCNTLAGDWSLTDDGSVQFSAGIMTLMACEGVDTWLSGASFGVLRGGTMTLSDTEGLVLGQLFRA